MRHARCMSYRMLWASTMRRTHFLSSLTIDAQESLGNKSEHRESTAVANTSHPADSTTIWRGESLGIFDKQHPQACEGQHITTKRNKTTGLDLLHIQAGMQVSKKRPWWLSSISNLPGRPKQRNHHDQSDVCLGPCGLANRPLTNTVLTLLSFRREKTSVEKRDDWSIGKAIQAVLV